MLKVYTFFLTFHQKPPQKTPYFFLTHLVVAGGPLSAAPQGDGNVVLRHVPEDDLSPVQERMWTAQVLQGTQDSAADQSERVGFVDIFF